MTIERIRMFGAGVRARMLLDLIQWQFHDRFKLDGYYDDRRAGESGPGGLPVFGTFAQGLDEMPRLDCWALVAAGTVASANGCRVLAALRAAGVRIASLVSPAAHVSPSAVLGQNAVIFPGVFLGAEVRVGHLLCVYAGTAVEHHGQLGHNVLLATEVVLGGFCRVGSHSFVGTGSVVAPERRIGTGTLVGAGSLVLRDVPDHVIAYGRPAAAARDVRPGDEVPTPEEISRIPPLE
jgi:sugar O-acyltransferase (sialic acid O-acetyltransferase NeuD family)